MEGDNVKITLKWGKKVFKNVEVDISSPPVLFKTQVFSLTGVPPERQKYLGLKGVKGGLLNDEGEWKGTGIKPGMTLMMMGSAVVLKQLEKPILFLEDMTEEEKSKLHVKTMPTGLRNIGNTCYANASLQVMLTAQGLKEELLKVMEKSSERNNGNLTVGMALSSVVSELEKSEDAVNPFMFIAKLRQEFPQFDEKSSDTGLHRQQDAEEFWTVTLNLLERSLPYPVINDLFGFQMVHKYTNVENPTEVESKISKEKKLVCHITSETNHLHIGLGEGMKEHVDKNSLNLGRQCVFEKESKLASLPQYLTIHFARFYWKADKTGRNEDGGVRAKILRTVKFTMALDMYDFCTEKLQEKLKVRRVEMTELEAADKGKQPAVEEKIPENNDDDDQSVMAMDTKNPLTKRTTRGFYDLVGVVSHQGRSAAGGHYNGWARADVGKPWFRYDDETVMEVREEDILKLSGGADWHIAYLLLYKLRME